MGYTTDVVRADSGDVFDDAMAAPGFIRTTGRPPLDGRQRAALIRRGNELFNAGKLADAKRIFITTHYTDGLIRLGDHYARDHNVLEAFRMYWLAPDHRKTDYMIEQMAGVVRGWLKSDS